MHKALQLVVLTTGLAASALAGPTLACHEWVSTPVPFSRLSNRYAKWQWVLTTRPRKKPSGPSWYNCGADIKPDDPVSLLKAGYWAEVLHAIGVSPDTDGPELMLRALALRPERR